MTAEPTAAMSPAAIIAALRAPSPGPVVWGALDALVRRRVASLVSDPSDRDDIAQNVLFKFAQQARDGVAVTGEHDGEVVRYLDQMVRNGRNDLWRRAQRAPVLDEEPGDRPDPAVPADDALARADAVARAVALFDRVADAVIEATPGAFRDDRRAARRQVEALYFSDETVDDVVARDEGLADDAPPAERRRAANRVMKQHQRFREAMVAMADARHARGELTDDERRLVARMVTELKRR
ncbi:MAG: hypothetical protein U0324_40760 [Polyangiales bacterium]